MKIRHETYDTQGNLLSTEDIDVPVIEQIKILEAKQTPRRMREAALGVDGGWLSFLNTQIAALRALL